MVLGMLMFLIFAQPKKKLGAKTCNNILYYFSMYMEDSIEHDMFLMDIRLKKRNSLQARSANLLRAAG